VPKTVETTISHVTEIQVLIIRDSPKTCLF